MPKTQKVTKRSRYVSKHYGDDKANPGGPRNYAAGREERPTKKLLELMCKTGAKTQGKACRTCVSRCRFGEEYLDRMQKGDEA
jgi:hypothetical protein